MLEQQLSTARLLQWELFPHPNPLLVLGWLASEVTNCMVSDGWRLLGMVVNYPTDRWGFWLETFGNYTKDGYQLSH